MDKSLYEIEEKLHLASSSRCTPAEVNAIKTVLAQGQKLPEGIFVDKAGRYCKYDAGLLDESEKDRIVKYETLLQLKRLYALIAIGLGLVVLCAAAIAVILLLK